MTRLNRLLIFILVIGCVTLFSGVVAQEGDAASQTANQTTDVNVTITSPEDKLQCRRGERDH